MTWDSLGCMIRKYWAMQEKQSDCLFLAPGPPNCVNCVVKHYLLPPAEAAFCGVEVVTGCGLTVGDGFSFFASAWLLLFNFTVRLDSVEMPIMVFFQDNVRSV